MIGVDIGGAQIDSGKAFHDLVGQPDGCIDAHLQRDFIRNTHPIRIGQLDPTLPRELDDLETRPVHENDLNAQRTQDGQIKENVGEIVRSGHLSIEGNNKHALPETGNVLKDFAQVGYVHFDAGKLPG